MNKNIDKWALAGQMGIQTHRHIGTCKARPSEKAVERRSWKKTDIEPVNAREKSRQTDKQTHRQKKVQEKNEQKFINCQKISTNQSINLCIFFTLDVFLIRVSVEHSGRIRTIDAISARNAPPVGPSRGNVRPQPTLCALIVPTGRFWTRITTAARRAATAASMSSNCGNADRSSTLSVSVRDGNCFEHSIDTKNCFLTH